MTTYLALLRGINVGGNNMVSMKALKGEFEALGFSNVATFINSGNVVFTSRSANSKALTKKLETALHRKFGFPIRVLLRDRATLASMLKKVPASWTDDKIRRTYVLFLWDSFASEKTLKLLAIKDGIDTAIYANGAVVWTLLMKDRTRSAMARFVGTELYRNTTVRNINTVRKLAVMMR